MKCKKSRPNKRAAFCLENYLFCGGLVVQLKCAGKKIRRQPHFAESRSVNANGVFVYDFAVNGKNSAQSVDKRAGAVAAKSSDFPICGKQRALPLFGINGKKVKALSLRRRHAAHESEAEALCLRAVGAENPLVFPLCRRIRSFDFRLRFAAIQDAPSQTVKNQL